MKLFIIAIAFFLVPLFSCKTNQENSNLSISLSQNKELMNLEFTSCSAPETLSDYPFGTSTEAVLLQGNIIVLSLGERPSSGYSIELLKVETDGETLFLQIGEKGPERGMRYSQVITYPKAFYQLNTHKNYQHIDWNIIKLGEMK